MYRVVVDDARDQIAALPSHVLHAYADVIDVISVAPWNGPAFHERNPGGNLRVWRFGDGSEGSVVYLIFDHPPEVHVLVVQWLGF